MTTRRDGAERLLDAATTVLPAGRRQWGAAMTAELAVIDARHERRRFARSCVRAICLDPLGLCALAARLVVATSWVVAATFASHASVAVLIQAILLLIAIAGVAVAGRRDGLLGPVPDNAIAGRCRMTGYLLTGALLIMLLRPRDGGPTHDPAGFWIAASMIVIFLVATLRLTTGERSRLLLVVASSAICSAVLWSALLVASGDVRATPTLSLLVVGAAAFVAATLTVSSGSSDRFGAASAAAATVVAAGLLVFLATRAVYSTVPSLVPHFANQGGPGPLTAVDARAQERAEAIDPYIVLLFIGAFAGLVTIASTRTGLRLPSAGARPSACHVVVD